MPRWIAFDAVGTLIYPDPDVATAYAVIGQKYGSSCQPGELRPRFAQVFADSAAACLPSRDGDVFTDEDLEVARWRWIVEQMLPDVTDSEACFQELYDHFASPANWRLFPDVAATFAALNQQAIRLAVASNFDQRLPTICRGFSEFDAVEHIVVSTQVNACKPSARFYHGLLQTCGCLPDELWMIGDEWDSDVAGPEKLGIRALWLDRKSTGQHPNSSSIPSLTELISML